ncbi:high-affinity branched-chain amino acid ABC transporter permease LivM [Methylobacterium sp. Leaf106]|uniref:high-affinity branched-chain amino acid ABC transporter permease LivM n=1 Tax=Methylobacterium sp. Leaf106 TaxID=1736255 RepID=UPI000A982967|nr:high-affinity branched-chain amino acid ABC transporter permease LivM [Methylobacterium sp. Leaf106]
MASGSTTPIAAPARAEASPLPGLIKDAGLFALVTLGLCVPIVSYRTDLGQGIGLVITSRWGTVLALCAAIFVLRLVQQLYLTGRARRRAARAPVVEGASRLAAILAPITLVVALTLPLLASLLTGSLGEGRYWIDLGILILTYVMLGWGLNIVVGLAGLLDLGYVAFYAVGAYSYALLSTVFGLSFWICLPLAGLFAAAFGVLLGFPVLRLRGDYLAIVTLAFGEIIRLVLINWTDFSGGAAGISSIPRVSFFGLPFTAGENGFAATFGLSFNAMHRLVFLYYLILVLALVTNLVTLRMRRLPLGRAWEALREDEIACRSLGIDTTITKLTAFALGAMFAGFAGSFFAVRQAFVSPESFNFLESAIILAIVVLGGMGSQIGVAIAAIVMIGGPELLRNLGFLKAVFGEGFDPNEYRLLLFGLAMVAMMVFRPRGLISERTPSVTIAERGR